MNDSNGVEVVGAGITAEQAKQLKSSGRLDVEKVSTPNAEGRNAFDFDRIALAKVVFSESNQSKFTDGQVLMANLLAKKVSGEWQARPTGMAVAFANREMFTQHDASTNIKAGFYDAGAVVLTTPIKVDNKLAFVGVNKNGVFLIEGKGVDQDDKLNEFMLTKFDSIDDQESNSAQRKTHGYVDLWLTGDAGKDFEYKNERVVKLLDETMQGDLVAKVLKTAVEESISAPLISTADYKKGVEKEPNGVTELAGNSTPSSVNLRILEF